jgi:hypothetical protein
MGAKGMSDIVERLRFSISFRAFDGDALERSVCAQQMSEAANEIERLRRQVAQRGVKMEAMNALLREAMESEVSDYWYVRVREMQDWFNEDGVPK